MSGYPGNLSDTQALALEEMKKRIVDIWKDKFTDHYLLRWLRAREFDAAEAEIMLRKDATWRSTHGMDTILETYNPPEILRRYLPGGLFNHDREGRPVWLMPLGDGDYRGILQCHPKDDVITHVGYLVEEFMEDMKKQTVKVKHCIVPTLSYPVIPCQTLPNTLQKVFYGRKTLYSNLPL